MQVSALVSVIVLSAYDRAEYASALQPVLRACDERLAGLAATDAPAFATAVRAVTQLASGLVQADSSSEGRTHLQKLAECDAAPPVARLLYVLATVVACPRSCEDVSAAVLCQCLDTSLQQAVMTAEARSALCGAFASACSSGKQCACQHAVLTDVLACATTGVAQSSAVSTLNHFQPLDGVLVPTEGGALAEVKAQAQVALLSPSSHMIRQFINCGSGYLGPPALQMTGVHVTTTYGQTDVYTLTCDGGVQFVCAACLPAEGDCWQLVRRMASSPFQRWAALLGSRGQAVRIVRGCNKPASLRTGPEGQCWVMLVVSHGG